MADSDLSFDARERHLKQNREIIRINGLQASRIAALEGEVTRLLSENIQLRTQTIQLRAAAKNHTAALASEADLKDKRILLERGLRDLHRIVRSLGQSSSTATSATAASETLPTACSASMADLAGAGAGVVNNSEHQIPLTTTMKKSPKKSNLLVVSPDKSPEHTPNASTPDVVDMDLDEDAEEDSMTSTATNNNQRTTASVAARRRTHMNAGPAARVSPEDIRHRSSTGGLSESTDNAQVLSPLAPSRTTASERRRSSGACSDASVSSSTSSSRRRSSVTADAIAAAMRAGPNGSPEAVRRHSSTSTSANANANAIQIILDDDDDAAVTNHSVTVTSARRSNEEILRQQLADAMQAARIDGADTIARRSSSSSITTSTRRPPHPISDDKENDRSLPPPTATDRNRSPTRKALGPVKDTLRSRRNVQPPTAPLSPVKKPAPSTATEPAPAPAVIKPEPISPASTVSRAAFHFGDDLAEADVEGDVDGSAAGSRSRRAARSGVLSYAEPSLRTKMRRTESLPGDSRRRKSVYRKPQTQTQPPDDHHHNQDLDQIAAQRPATATGASRRTPIALDD
ncbi:hypothetical protein PYCC9005_004471 [Savitreella phatthalungensis]